MGYPRGDVDAVSWMEIPAEAIAYASERPADGGTAILVSARGGSPDDAEMDAITARRNNNARHFHLDIGLVPIDAAALFPGRHVVYDKDSWTKGDLDAWARTAVEVPGGIDVRFEWGGWCERVVAIARTVRKGRLTEVRRTIKGPAPFAEAAAKELGYFARNCPAPPEALSPYNCWEHVSRIMARAEGLAAQLVREWLEGHGRAENSWQRPEPLTLHGGMLPGAGVDHVTLDLKHATSTVRARIQVGGHTFADDDGGVEIKLQAELPASVRMALAGRTFDQVLDLPWADALTVRVARDPQKDAPRLVPIRAVAEGAAFEIPNTARRSDARGIELLHERLRAAEASPVPQRDACDFNGLLRAGVAPQHGALRMMEASALDPLSRLSPGDLSTVLDLALHHAKVDLGRFGLPGWTVGQRGDTMIVLDSPHIGVEELLGRFTGDDIQG